MIFQSRSTTHQPLYLHEFGFVGWIQVFLLDERTIFGRWPNEKHIKLVPSMSMYVPWWNHRYRCYNMLYPLINIQKTMERSTIFNGKIHYFYGHFQSQTVSLPEGKSPMFCWLVVWNMAFMTSPIVGMMIQSDELIFFRGVGIPPTSFGRWIVFDAQIKMSWWFNPTMWGPHWIAFSWFIAPISLWFMVRK